MKAVLDVGHIGLKINGCVLGSVKLEGKAGLLMGTSPDHSLRFCICIVNLLAPRTLLKLLTFRESSFIHISVVAEPGLCAGSVDHYLYLGEMCVVDVRVLSSEFSCQLKLSSVN